MSQKGRRRVARERSKVDKSEELERLRIFPEARIYKTRLTNKYRERKRWERDVAGEIRSVIPGTVTSIEVEVGQSVTAGETLLIYQAMKMQNRVTAPSDGVVEKILVKEGERCPREYLLMKLEVEEEELFEDSINDGDLGLIV